MKVTSYGAFGRVAIGYSCPWVAKYIKGDGVYTNEDARRLARGVSVKISPDTSDDNKFYADNQVAESDAGTFTGGTLTVTPDGLHPEAERYIYGIPEPDADGITHEGDSAIAPDLSYGHITKYRCSGVDMYRPEVLCKIKFHKMEKDVETQGEEIDWQTNEMSATIMRSDNANHDWRLLGEDWTTEAEAEQQLKSMIGAS